MQRDTGGNLLTAKAAKKIISVTVLLRLRGSVDDEMHSSVPPA
jgi:hypothetical protein